MFGNQCANAVCASLPWEQLEWQPVHSVPGTGTSLCHGGLAHDCSVWVRCMGEETLGNASWERPAALTELLNHIGELRR